MKEIFLPIFAIFLALSCGTKSEKSEQTISKVINEIGSVTLPSVIDCGYQVSPDQVKGWDLIFEDDFKNGYEKNWTAWRGGAYNEELQHYQEENIFVDNGYLFIQGKRETVEGRTRPDDKKIKKFDFTSGRLESKKLYGPKDIDGKRTIKLSARVRLVEGEAMWPAWWSYGDPWPTKGELDILEARGNKPYEFSSCFHYGKKASIPDTDFTLNVFEYKHIEKLTDCFHVYDLEWSEESFKILFDGQLVKLYDTENSLYIRDFWLKQHKLCLNLAIGGIFFESYDVTKIPDESYYVIDWVKVYEQ